MNTPTPLWGSGDPLGRALHFMRMTGVFTCASELTAPWGLSLPPIPDTVMFHVVLEGTCTVEVDGGHQVLAPGELALVPHGRGHDVFDTDGAPIHPILELERELVSPRYERLVHGGGGAHTRLLCGAVEFDHPGASALTRLLPPIIHVADWPEAHRAWVDASIAMMSHEAAVASPGSETIVTRLADVFVVQAIRSWIVSNPDALTGWLRGLRDPKLGRAILAMHESPGQDWTVTSLARVCGMSRSGFSAAFKEVVGESPARHLAGWRMQLAHARLREDDVSLAELAEELGYASQAAFSRAFKRHTGQNPSDVRVAHPR